MAMNKKDFTFESTDGVSSVCAFEWSNPDAPPKYVLHLVHGMCEYMGRYERFAEFMCEHGALVVGADHLGHGSTQSKNAPRGAFGYFADKNGDSIVVADVHALIVKTQAEHPGLPYVLFGHSMGSLMVRRIIAEYHGLVDACVICGTSGTNNLTGLIRFLAGVGMFFGRAKKPAKLMTYLAFHKYNDRYENVQTENDWITRDPEILASYSSNPLCTFKFTDRAAYDMANLVDSVQGLAWANKADHEIPYLVISGTMDPVGNYGDGVREVVDFMRQAKIPDLTVKLYDGARHELLNEINRDEVYHDVLNWVQEKVK